MRFGMGYDAWTGGPRGGGHGSRGCGPRGRGSWDRLAEEFVAQWGEAQRGGRGRRRMFDGGELRLVLLRLIADEPRHGYDLIRQIEELTGGAYAPSPGVVYPTLTLLDDMGLIDEKQSEGSKKLYAATDLGYAHLAENKEQVDELMARLEAVGAHRARTDRASIRRAMGNLRVALQYRMSKDDLSDDVIHQVTALIDEVTQKIERL